MDQVPGNPEKKTRFWERLWSVAITAAGIAFCAGFAVGHLNARNYYREMLVQEKHAVWVVTDPAGNVEWRLIQQPR